MCMKKFPDTVTDNACEWLARLTCVVLGCAVAVSLFDNLAMVHSLHALGGV